jgi:hypothetical protein
MDTSVIIVNSSVMCQLQGGHNGCGIEEMVVTFLNVFSRHLTRDTEEEQVLISQLQGCYKMTVNCQTEGFGGSGRGFF